MGRLRRTTVTNTSKRFGRIPRFIKDVPEDMGLSFALPIVEFPDGNRMSQLPMILDVMGEKLGLHGDSLEEKLAVKQILLDLDDLLTETFNGKWTDANGRKDKWFKLLEKRLSLNTFLAKHSPTVADFHGILAMESAIAKYGAIDASVYPKVAAWWTALNALPAVKKARELDIKLFP